MWRPDPGQGSVDASYTVRLHGPAYGAVMDNAGVPPTGPSSGLVRPEDVLADGQDSTEINGVVVRKGTIGAFLANARALSAMPTDSPRREPLIKELRDSARTLEAIGLFDIFEFRSPELAELINAPRF